MPGKNPASTTPSRVARDLKEAVPEEEDAGAEAVRSAAESQVAVHVERREADIHAVQEVRDVEREHERDETTGHAAERRGLELRAGITHRGAAPRGDGSR